MAETRIENARLLTEAGLTDGGMGVAVAGSELVATGRDGSLPPADRVVDVEGAIVAPGIVDEHVHDRSLGQTHKEDWETLTRAAAAGGATTVLGHGNTDPFVEDPDHLERKFERARRDALVDFGAFAWVTSNNYDRLAPLADAGAVGFQASLAERAPTDGQLLKAMETVAQLEERLGVHVENGAIIDRRTESLRAGDSDHPSDHGRARPAVAERAGAATVVELARETGCPLHVFQVSAGSTLVPLERARRDGLDLTVETCPHYLWFTDEEMDRQGSAAVVSPPLRSGAERDRLREGIAEGVVDCIGTDHAPHTDAEKAVEDPFGSVWEVDHGFVGLETAVPALLTLASEGLLTLPEWIRMASSEPARTWGLYPQKGSLQPGTDADLVVIDPDREWTLDRTDLHSKGRVTPFDGQRFRGRVTATMVRGEFVYRKGEVVGSPGDGRRVS
jgi:dihydroorotase/allantoinase